MNLTIVEFREAVRKRPGMFMGAAWMSCFSTWMLGVMQLESLHNIPEEDRIFPYLDEFEKYLSRRSGYSGSVRSFGYARKKAGNLKKKANQAVVGGNTDTSFNEDAEAYNIWMKLYDDFIKKRKV